MHRGLEGKVALVTGAGRGLGEAIALVLGEAGATIVAADLDLRAAERIAGKLRDAGTSVSALALDVGDERQAADAVEQVVRERGRLDCLINNAGTDVTVSVEELTVADWDRVIRTNLRGPFLLSRAAFPVMKRQGHGHIVNIASTAAKRAWANASAYHASKWGLLGLSHALHVEARPHGVKVTAIVAGGMRTPFLLDRFPDLDPNVLQDPRSVAETVLFTLTQPAETVIPEVMVLPMRETSWP
jgi:NAD(P)-dependent dehydrogenase (short-subunit alcohol dehydrogenase family)